MMDGYQQVAKSEGFDWDFGNLRKNLDKHQVNCEEAEQVFEYKPFFLLDDPTHSRHETRIKAFRKTKKGKLLTLTFTMRRNLIRIISARPMHKKERKIYEEQAEKQN